MAKATKSGNTAKAGISGTSTSKATTSRSEANENTSYSTDAFIDAYISDRISGGTPETATTAGRSAAGMNTTAAGNSAAERALAAGDAYIDPMTGRVTLYDSVNRAAGSRTYAQYEKETTPEERYAARVRETEAEQTPRYSESDTQENHLVIPDFSTGEIERMDNSGYERWRSSFPQPQEKEEQSPLQRFDEWASEIGVKKADGPVTDWTSQAPLPTGGGDGAVPGLENQTGKKPDAQYLYPENGNTGIRFQSLEPFEDWQTELIDRMNDAYADRDFNEVERLRKVYTGGQDSYLRNNYTESLPEGADAYQGIRDAINAGDRTSYNEERFNLRANGFSQDQIDDQAAETIHRSDMSTKEKEAALQNYLGLTASDAEATSIYWWFTDINGPEAADTDKNGKVKQDELGALLRQFETGGTLTEAQATAIWEQTFPTAKTTYSKWKGKKKK